MSMKSKKVLFDSHAVNRIAFVSSSHLKISLLQQVINQAGERNSMQVRFFATEQHFCYRLYVYNMRAYTKVIYFMISFKPVNFALTSHRRNATSGSRSFLEMYSLQSRYRCPLSSDNDDSVAQCNTVCAPCEYYTF